MWRLSAHFAMLWQWELWKSSKAPRFWHRQTVRRTSGGFSDPTCGTPKSLKNKKPLSEILREWYRTFAQQLLFKGKHFRRVTPPIAFGWTDPGVWVTTRRTSNGMFLVLWKETRLANSRKKPKAKIKVPARMKSSDLLKFNEVWIISVQKHLLLQ